MNRMICKSAIGAYGCINIDLELKPVNPPTVLYNGTAEKYVASIEAEGLISKSRQYVHLSADIETALTVGSRHGSPVIYEEVIICEK